VPRPPYLRQSKSLIAPEASMTRTSRPWSRSYRHSSVTARLSRSAPSPWPLKHCVQHTSTSSTLTSGDSAARLSTPTNGARLTYSICSSGTLGRPCLARRSTKIWTRTSRCYYAALSRCVRRVTLPLSLLSRAPRSISDYPSITHASRRRSYVYSTARPRSSALCSRTCSTLRSAHLCVRSRATRPQMS
jgi:hypothetical protein